MKTLVIPSLLSAGALVVACGGNEAGFTGSQPGLRESSRGGNGADGANTGDANALPDHDPNTPPAPPPLPPPSFAGLSQTFTSGHLETFSLSFTPDYRYTTQMLTLRELSPRAATFTQAARTLVQDMHTQGRDGQRAAPESFSVTGVGRLDLLVVVDNSTSMTEEQGNLGSKLDPLLSRIADTDWQVAVVTTSSPCLRNGRLIKKGDADARQAFQAAVVVPLSNAVAEKGFPQAIRALRGECNGVTAPWIRPDSSIAVLVVSDEDNCGSHVGEGCPNDEGQTPEEMVAFLRSIRPPEQARIYGLFEGPGNACGASALEAFKYKAGVDMTGGTWGSICDADYTATLQRISDNAAGIVKREFRLAYPPDAGTLMVTLDGTPVAASGFVVAGNMITLQSVPPQGATLVATYSYGSVPKTSRFATSVAPDPSTIAVTVNGTVASAAYDAATREVVLDAEPADDARIRVAYRRGDQTLPTTLSLAGHDVLGTPVAVEVDGTALAANAWSWDAAALTVGFAAAPRDSTALTVRYRTPGGRITRYAAAVADPGAALAVSARDAATDAALAVLVDAAGELVLASAEVWEGRLVAIDWELGYAPNGLVHELPHQPVDGSLQVASASGDAACGAGATVTGRLVRLSCPQRDAGELTITYAAAAFGTNVFAVDGAVPEGATWQVLVNGAPTTAYTRDGGVVVVDWSALPPAGATVTIEVTP